MTTTSALQLSLADVARLAGVQRPVASMWRKRALPGQPFPEPVAVIEGQERFDAFAIADYLAATGRGNIRVEREDVAAHAHLAGADRPPEHIKVAGLTALLTLGTLTDAPLAQLSDADLTQLARESDPDDTYLRREIDALGAQLQTLATHAEALADASYTAPAAFELLLRQQLHRSLPDRAALALRGEALELVAQVADALAEDAGWAAPLFVDVTDSSGDLLLTTIKRYAAELAPSAATVSLDTPSARLLRRRLVVHDIHRVPVRVDADGDFSITTRRLDGSIHVVQLPTLANLAMSDVEVLEAVGDLVVQLADDSRVVVIGPASALTDRPGSVEVDRARDAVLRTGRLRAAIRLPAGLVVRSPRQHLALWALGPAHADVPIADRWTVVGDLSSASLRGSVIQDIVTDVVASMTGSQGHRAHAYRFARPVSTATLIPGRKSLVAGPVRASASVARTMLLGEAVGARLCRVIPGNRVRREDVLAHGRPVVGQDELVGASAVGSRCVDPVAFPSAYPGSRYTEAGDVVFCTSPRVAAWVDREGGSVVLSPARTLRVAADPDNGIPPLVSEVIAADINAGGAKDWRRWPIRIVPRERQADLTMALAQIAAQRAELETRLADLQAQAARAMDDATRPEQEGL
ncbi:hypothetical protein N864_08715 [Intrasporangium chromatireducens Q5-1]|uniref:Uncharacterized protein n=1 Tax=Intrasporangium chromatireducens Q5-1 TaxID=584657 RepID=W9GKB5_9MICO|nr:hypothetical protein [Intrasporangium chromatireducens]EWT04339.1 hypothetical protein N864_08715 [Intrasporangium chromatireducens Q5-1]